MGIVLWVLDDMPACMLGCDRGGYGYVGHTIESYSVAESVGFCISKKAVLVKRIFETVCMGIYIVHVFSVMS